MRIKRIAGQLLAAWIVLLCLLPGHASGDDRPTFLVAVQGAYARLAPGVAAPVAFAAPQGQSYTVTGRSADNAWINVGNAWLPALLGDLSGDLNTVPVTPLPAGFAANSNRAVLPSWIPVATPAARQVLQRGVRAGRDPRVFTVAGDSNSLWPRYLGRVAAGSFDLSRNPGMRSVASRYDPSFTRRSLAVQGGIGAADMFDPAKADPSACQPGEGMLPCELRASRASIVFIQLGTGDRFAWRDFEANYRRMLDYSLSQSVLPILVTKADDMESWQGGAPIDHINSTIRRLAQKYRLPLLDFWAATRTLPTVPNPDLPDRPFTQYGLQDEWGYYFHLTDEGMALRILATLQTLDALTRGK